MNNFSVSESFAFGWEKFKLYPGAIAVFTLALFGVGAISGKIPMVGWLAYSYALALYTKMSLEVHGGKEPKLETASISLELFGRYLLGSLLYGLIVLGGLLLLVVPGIIWALRYGMYAYLILDRGMKPNEALRASKQMTKGKLGRLALFALASVGVGILGVLALGIGVVVAYPIVMLASVHIYRNLSATSPTSSPTAPVESAPVTTS